MTDLTRLRVIDFLNNYGDKGFIILKTIIDLALDPTIDHRLGDFNYKLLVIRLRKQGIDYNPINMLRILEKEYGLIEKTYDSKRQKWWRINDLESIRRALYSYTGSPVIDDPRIRLLLLKYKSLEPGKILNQLRRIALKQVLSSVDKRIYREIVFNELDKLVEIMEKMMEHEDIFSQELEVLNEIMLLAEKIASKINSESTIKNIEEIKRVEETEKSIL